MRNIIVILLLFLPIKVFAQDQNVSKKEITASAEATYFLSPDYISIEVIAEQISATVQEASLTLDKKQNYLEDTVKKISPSIEIILRGNNISSSANAVNRQLRQGQSVNVKRSFLIETYDLSKQSLIVDSILQSGQYLIKEVNYYVRKNNKNLLSAISQATEEAKAKIDTIAKSLGLTLDNLISADTVEEAEGEVIQEKILSNSDLSNYGDKKLQVVVTLKYSVK